MGKSVICKKCKFFSKKETSDRPDKYLRFRHAPNMSKNAYQYSRKCPLFPSDFNKNSNKPTTRSKTPSQNQT
jgi:hypothetical protein